MVQLKTMHLLIAWDKHAGQSFSKSDLRRAVSVSLAVVRKEGGGRVTQAGPLTGLQRLLIKRADWLAFVLNSSAKIDKQQLGTVL